MCADRYTTLLREVSQDIEMDHPVVCYGEAFSLFGGELDIEAHVLTIEKEKEASPRKRRILMLADVTHFLCPLNDLIIPDSNRTHYINNTRLLLTYSARLLQGSYSSWLTQRLSERQDLCVKSISFAPDREKMHVLVTWNRVFKCRHREILDYQGLHPVLRRLCNGAQLRRVQNYMALCRSTWAPVL